MTIPARLIAPYLTPASRTQVLTATFAPAFTATHTQAEAMISADTVVGIVRGRTLKYLQLLVPVELCYRRRGETSTNRAHAKDRSLPRCEDNRTWVQVGSSEYSHHWAHCLAFGPLASNYADHRARALAMEGL